MLGSSDLSRLALRVGRFGETLVQAHAFETPQGTCDRPWTSEFQRRSFVLYYPHLTPRYRRRLGAVFAEGARSIQWPRSEDERIVESYLHNGSQAISEGLDANGTANDGAPKTSLFRDRTPAVVPFTAIASLVSRTGAKRLMDAGFAVAGRHGPHEADDRISDDDVALIQLLANGYRVIDLAEHRHVSERTMYRDLRSLRRRVGVASNNDAVNRAIRRGWI